MILQRSWSVDPALRALFDSLSDALLLLDRVFRQPFAELMKTLPVPERVYQALVDNTGPYRPYFDLVRAVESESLSDFREAADRLMLSVSEINRAQLRALAVAAELE